MGFLKIRSMFQAVTEEMSFGEWHPHETSKFSYNTSDEAYLKRKTTVEMVNRFTKNVKPSP
jgi:hypothetical protein